MKTLRILKQWLCSGCVYYTVIAIGILILSLMSDTAAGIAVTRFLAIFPAALCMSAGGMLWKTQNLPRWIRVLFLYLIDVLAVFLFLYLPVSVAAEAVTKLLMFVLLSVVFWIVFGLIMLISTRIRRLMAED